MMKRMLCLSLALCASAFAHDSNDAKIKKNLENQGIKNIYITDSPIKGLRSVVSDHGALLVSEDGQYYIQSNMAKITQKGLLNMSNYPLVQYLDNIKDEAIIYPAQNEKYVVNVFTDTTCKYCVKLHNDIKKFNELGITIRYFAYPRNGLSDTAAREMETVWTAEDKQAEYEKSKAGEKVGEKDLDIVRKHFALGHLFGINGTPAIILPNGEVLGGYTEPAKLAKILENLQALQ